jgi:hypothetical protein
MLRLDLDPLKKVQKITPKSYWAKTFAFSNKSQNLIFL